MKNLLQNISKKAIQLADIKFSQMQIKNSWLGTNAALKSQILQAENRLGKPLPDDYKTFLQITNGFTAPNDIEPSFEAISNIDYLKNIDMITINAYRTEGMLDLAKKLEKSILIAGINQEQYFLLIPPDAISKQWQYWKFAHWLTEEQEHENLKSYFESVLIFLTENKPLQQ